MRNFTVLLAAIVASALNAQFVNAAIEATSNLAISDFLVHEIGGDGILLNSISGGTVIESSDTEASLDGFAPVMFSVASVDGTIASLGTAVGENSFPAHGTTGLAYAYSDSDGSGSIVVASGASSRTQSGIGVSAGAPLTGMTSATSSLTVFSFSTLHDLSVNFTFDGLLDLTLDNMASAPPLAVDAAGSFIVTLTGTAPGGFFVFYSSSLDALVDDLSSVTESLTGPGSVVGPQVDGSFASSSIFLRGGGSYTLTLSQSTSASLRIVPEPTALLVWGLIGIMSSAVSRRRRDSSV